MHLIERLEKRARELDRQVMQSVWSGSYRQKAADDRELLLEAADFAKWCNTVVDAKAYGWD